MAGWLLCLAALLSWAQCVLCEYNLPLSHDDALKKMHFPRGGSWHFYDPAVDKSDTAQCKHFYAEHANASAHFAATIERYKLWSGLVGEERMRRLTPNDTLFGLEHALDAIWRHQHPPSCSEAKFLIASEHDGGFGSEMHVLANPLGLAMDLGRVYLLNPVLHQKNTWELDNPFCANQTQNHGLECYYEPLSSCTVFDALGANALSVLRKLSKHYQHTKPRKVLRHFTVDDTRVAMFALGAKEVIPYLYSKGFLNEIGGFAGAERVLLLHNLFRMGSTYIPRALRPLAACSPMQTKFEHYWWRAVSAAYFLRPNNATRLWLQSHHNASIESALAAHETNSVAVYVRRGDKSREMRIVPLAEYTDALRLLWSAKYLDDETARPRVIFFASESSETLREMEQWVRDQPRGAYELHYTTTIDRAGLYAEMSAEERDRGGFVPRHHPEEVLAILLNLQYLVQTSGWVCTLASNFCRVVDELRAALAGRAARPFADLSGETCVQPPCIYGEFHYIDWR